MIDNAVKQLIEQRAGPGVLATPASSPITVRAGDKPRVIYTNLSGPRDYNDDGPIGLCSAKIQLDVITDTIANARSITGKLMASAAATPPGLDGFVGTVDGTLIIRISFDEEPRSSGGVELKTEGGNAALCRLILPATVVYRT